MYEIFGEKRTGPGGIIRRRVGFGRIPEGHEVVMDNKSDRIGLSVWGEILVIRSLGSDPVRVELRTQPQLDRPCS